MEQNFLFDLTILFGVSVLTSYLFRALRLSTIVGFLVAGVLIGPGGFALIESTEEVRQMEEIGVMLLMFSIGVEFSIERLRSRNWMVLMGGSSQVLATGLVAGTIAVLISGSMPLGIVIGMLTALSSTVIGLRLLQEQGLSLAPQGQVSLGILIFQGHRLSANDALPADGDGDGSGRCAQSDRHAGGFCRRDCVDPGFGQDRRSVVDREDRSRPQPRHLHPVGHRHAGRNRLDQFTGRDQCRTGRLHRRLGDLGIRIQPPGPVRRPAVQGNVIQSSSVTA